MIDVSDNNGPIDWQKVKASGVQRAYLKAWEYVADPLYIVNDREARANGIQVGAYCFGHPGLNANVQGSNFARHMHVEPGDLPPALDLEVDDGLPLEHVILWKTDFYAAVDPAARCRSALYSDRYWLNLLVPHIYPDRPVWGAAPGAQLTQAERSRWFAHQYSFTGRVPGIKGYVDLDQILKVDVPTVPPLP